MSQSDLISLAQTADKRVPLNSTIRETTLNRLDVLTAQARAHNPDINRSQIVDNILTERLDVFNITA